MAAFWLSAGLAGCTPAPLIDRLPGELGLPQGAPARPAAPYRYPAVHDMPPERGTAPMSEEEQLKLEKELQAVRDRQERQAAQEGDQPAPAAKKKPAGSR